MQYKHNYNGREANNNKKRNQQHFLISFAVSDITLSFSSWIYTNVNVQIWHLVSPTFDGFQWIVVGQQVNKKGRRKKRYFFKRFVPVCVNPAVVSLVLGYRLLGSSLLPLFVYKPWSSFMCACVLGGRGGYLCVHLCSLVVHGSSKCVTFWSKWELYQC